MAQALSYPQLFWTFILLCLLIPAHGQSAQSNYSSVFDALPELLGLNLRRSDRPPSIGGQNFTWCCLLAVKESYTVQNGQVINTGSGFIDLSFENLSSSQFPCGATYNGNHSGAPPVTVPYSWCNQNCGGWQQSKNIVLNQWILPFVGFILPAAVFCLNVSAPVCARILRHSTDLIRRYLESEN